jgi:hypothetical protein
MPQPDPRRSLPTPEDRRPSRSDTGKPEEEEEEEEDAPSELKTKSRPFGPTTVTAEAVTSTTAQTIRTFGAESLTVMP